VRPGPDPDRRDEPRQHEREVAQRLPARELRLALAQDDRMTTQLAHPDLERHPRPR